MKTNQLPTIGVIADRLDEPVHRIQYIVRARGIRPSGWAGNARVFSDEDVELIARELGRAEPGPAEKEVTCAS